jgi:hypothetical protein
VYVYTKLRALLPLSSAYDLFQHQVYDVHLYVNMHTPLSIRKALKNALWLQENYEATFLIFTFILFGLWAKTYK